MWNRRKGIEENKNKKRKHVSKRKEEKKTENPHWTQ